jgi:hypothetical protein
VKFRGIKANPSYGMCSEVQRQNWTLFQESVTRHLGHDQDPHLAAARGRFHQPLKPRHPYLHLPAARQQILSLSTTPHTARKPPSSFVPIPHTAAARILQRRPALRKHQCHKARCQLTHARITIALRFLVLRAISATLQDQYIQQLLLQQGTTLEDRRPHSVQHLLTLQGTFSRIISIQHPHKNSRRGITR